MYSSLFLHYGPGGSSDVEAVLLEKDLPNVLFWNQPKVKQLVNPYQNLVQMCVAEIQNKNVQQVIGHSFGCDLLASILKTSSDQIPKSISESSILVSPLQSVPVSMYNLGCVLNSKQTVPELTDILKIASEYKSDMPADIFWTLVIQNVTHPFYQSVFWVDQKAKAESDNLVIRGAPFDAEEWQTVMNDYLFVRAQNDSSALQGKNIKAIFGERDPYLTPEIFQYWNQLLGPGQIHIIKNCGHFPHIENRTEFLKAIKS